MSATIISHPTPSAGSWAQALADRGFTAAGNAWRQDGMSARTEARWLILDTDALTRPAGLGKSDIERPGLWKQVWRECEQRFVFEFPAALISQGCEAEGMEEGPMPELLLDWAFASANGEIPNGWLPPASELVDSWMPPGALTIRASCLVRQGELFLAQDRWALRFPILPCVPAELPADQRLALDLLAADAQNQRRMIRVGWVEQPDGAALTATVDLTGAPHSSILFLAGLEGLTHAVTWLAETADLLADVSVTLRALKFCHSPNQTNRKVTA